MQATCKSTLSDKTVPQLSYKEQMDKMMNDDNFVNSLHNILTSGLH